MNWKKMLGIIIIMGLLAFIIFKLMSNKKTTEAKVYHFDKNQPVYVQADTIKPEDVDIENAYVGNFEPFRETRLSAENQGKVNSIFVDIGSYVKQGQSLIQLDNSMIKLQLQSIDVQIEGLESDVSRYTTLAKADAVQGIQLEKAELGLKAARIQRATLLEQIEKSTIKSPISGIVTARLSEVGSFAAPGVPLLQITDIAQLKFTINVPENDLKNFRLNHVYRVTIDVYPDILLSGKAAMIGSKANPGNSYPVQFLVKNIQDMAIKSGMFGKVHLSGPSIKDIIIPSSAIVGSSETPQVYLVKDGKAQLQKIVVSKMIQDQSIISEGLKEGDIIITSGFINLEEGKEVLIKNQELGVKNFKK